jgi:geranylgeranyl diphosphate synthase type II
MGDPMGEAADSPSNRLAELKTLVEQALDEALPRTDSPTLGAFGARRLVESMRYSLGTPGKRMRPLLLLASAESAGAAPEGLTRFAAGIEMIHAYSLIHDDLPAMDDDDLRRGQPTNHVVFGTGMAILAGDGLLTEAFVALLEPVGARSGRAPVGSGLRPLEVDEALQMSVVYDVARAAGFDGMVGGQAADLLAEGMAPEADLLRSIHVRKTGALIHASVRAGARLAGAAVEELAALETFARHFGLAFQVADDVKDEVAPEGVTGKRGGGDREAGKMTYPALLGLQGARARCIEELERALAALGVLGARAVVLERLARDAVAPALDNHVD